MRKFLLVILLSVSMAPAFADHLKGGFFTYEYLGAGTAPNSSRYHVRLTVYMNCSSQTNPGQLTNPITFTFFDVATNQIVQNVNVSIAQQYRLEKTKDEECITGNQATCYYYIVIYDLPSIELQNNTNGYVVSYQRCCRIIDIQNMPSSPPSNNYGNTYSVQIPGNNINNSSASFLINDTAVVCGSSYFEVPFYAFDPDGDSLSFYFCDAWTGGGQQNTPANGPSSSTPNPAVAPVTTNPVTYPVIPYAGGFSGTAPLGSGVSINPQTGLISGIAPSNSGEYVVTVCVNEYRNGVFIARTRKELHLKVGQCSPIQATLDPQYVTCDGFTRSYFNQTNNGVTSYFWDFGVGSQTNDTANIATPTFTYPDTGIYIIKLVVNRGQPCSDSTTAIQKVYPGFFPGFTIAGVCVNKPTQFFDTTKTKYGFVDSWSWNFGNVAATNDTSHLQNPAYAYPTTGTKNVRFIVTNSKGCIDTLFKDIVILDKPPLSVVPSDTLICNGDNVQLQAIGSGIFSWSPGTNIINGNTATPTVNPTTTTNYIVQLEDNGCIALDTVLVRVVNFVTLQAMADTVICAGDSLRLHANTDGLQFTWSPSGSLNNPFIRTPTAQPTANTTYQITAIIGHCKTTDDVTVSLVPYPTANAGNDTTICFSTSAQLHGSMVGNSFSWSPASTLNSPNLLNPVATPAGTTAYVLSVTDILGCPKPKRDTVLVTVLPDIMASAGNDTVVVVGQPLQLMASGGSNYIWSPSTGLNATNIPDPIAHYNGNFDSITYKVIVFNEAGCFDSAFVTVKIFRTNPQIFVPSAFTPNGDGKNDLFRPIPVGMTKIDYFRVYNRWGQLVYSSPSTYEGGGWDGRINGKDQGSGTFVWLVKGHDYTGKEFFAKGIVTLIR